MHPVVLIHGLIGSFADPRTLASLQPAPALCPDLLGYGTQDHADPAEITIEAQAEYVRVAVDQAFPGTKVHLVGHSVGGVIAAVLAHRQPERVASLVSVEGNFTLADAFWSAQLATKPPAEVEEILRADRAAPAQWLRAGGIEPSDERIHEATRALAYQPSTTVQAMAHAVVELTGGPGYPQLLREVFERTPVHLIAGERSRSGWDVPAWALSRAASYSEVAATGHMLMLEAPEAFGRVLAELLLSRRAAGAAGGEGGDQGSGPTPRSG